MPDSSAATSLHTNAARRGMLRDVMGGLSLPQKEISPKYLYDARGSELFEDITRLDEYYPTRAERALLEQVIPGWIERSGPRAFVELGAGSATKSRIVLDAMADGPGALYVPVDVSADLLRETAALLREEYEGLRVEPAVADMTQPLDLPVPVPEPAWYALLGSTIGNFDEKQACRLLRRIASNMRPRDRFLLGIDRAPGPGKSRARIERAYNDEAGVTEAFTRNVLDVLNRELGADFDPAAYRYRAYYDDTLDRIEIHLVAGSMQQVVFPGVGVVRVDEGESIRTEFSQKYDRSRVEGLFAMAGMAVDRWAEDDRGDFALTLGRAAGPTPS